MIVNQLSDANIEHEFVRRSHLKFITHCWQKTDPFVVGRHTKIVCDEIDKAIVKFNNKESSYLIIKVPFRHGKSDIISRYLPPHFLGMFPDNDIIVATYGQDLSSKMSRFARGIVKSEQYKELYPEIKLSAESASVANWEINGRTGGTNWCGIGGAITGKGGNLCIIDDYLKNREDAESEAIRDKQWEWFTDVFMTRQAPVSITIILATPWHVDDIIGRIGRKTNPDSDTYDMDFPVFDVVCMPAMSTDYESGYLFPERFPEAWYKGKAAILGTYGTASLLQCSPTLKKGNLLKTSDIKIIDESQLPEGLSWVRGWDLASSKEERVKSDPDYTVGVQMAIKWVKKEGINDKMGIIYIKHIKRVREEAPERNRVILQTAEMDGNEVEIGVETVGGYKDAYTIIRDILDGIRSVTNINVSRDKIVRATPLEPVFEAGNVYLVRGEWNQSFIDEVGAFPSGLHDDQVDGLLVGYKMLEEPYDFSDIGSMTRHLKEGANPNV